MNNKRFLSVILILGILLVSRGAFAAHVLKFATLAPAGSTWMNLLEDWATEVEQRSEGRLHFKFYPGGIQGDEPDVLKKIRFNQLQGAAFSGHGIGQIYSPARVMELPYLFNSFAETDFVREKLMPEFEQGFHDNQFELLGWMEIGFVHIFSKEPVRTLDDMKSRRVWLWQGDPMGKAFFKASKIQPVPLSIIDVYTSLSTGLIDTVYSTPLASIAMQWFTKVKYMNDTPLTNAMGGLVVSRRFFDRLPADLQTLLRETGKATGKRLVSATREDNQKSRDELRKRGITFIASDEGISTEKLIAIRDIAASELMAQNYIPEQLIERTKTLLHDYRNPHTATNN
ncbi:MAG: TRAP transporter substrate-binding protein DctP [Gammaproteobacteria bacterium]